MNTSSYRQLVESGAVIAGSPQTVADQLLSILREFGVGNLHAMLQFGSLPRHLTKANIDLFAAEVLPRLRGLWDDGPSPHHWWPQRLGGQQAPLPATASPMAGTGSLTGDHK
ncbi:hypothetical protein [Streptomyces turgidiscabies]|uniref:Uncharacterized protein n=1 Tax=Streptomyces turgidiscabies TaxID=85558 RepID=A0ABU0RTB4_9ACTN|nr:hypothetical protein [Streptomyces turgidiscabies]MDQ0935245.1 hypothetical protein [Streptomyces turgidiscabies]